MKNVKVMMIHTMAAACGTNGLYVPLLGCDSML